MNPTPRAEDVVLAELSRNGGIGQVSNILLSCFQATDFTVKELLAAARRLRDKGLIHMNGDETELTPGAQIIPFPLKRKQE